MIKNGRIYIENEDDIEYIKIVVEDNVYAKFICYDANKELYDEVLKFIHGLGEDFPIDTKLKFVFDESFRNKFLDIITQYQKSSSEGIVEYNFNIKSLAIGLIGIGSILYTLYQIIQWLLSLTI